MWKGIIIIVIIILVLFLFCSLKLASTLDNIEQEQRKKGKEK